MGTYSAKSGGKNIFDGGDDITRYGIVWLSSPFETIDDGELNINNNTGIDEYSGKPPNNNFDANSWGEVPEIIGKLGLFLHVRAFIENSHGIAYGNIKTEQIIDVPLKPLPPPPTTQYIINYEIEFYKTDQHKRMTGTAGIDGNFTNFTEVNQYMRTRGFSSDGIKLVTYNNLVLEHYNYDTPPFQWMIHQLQAVTVFVNDVQETILYTTTGSINVELTPLVPIINVKFVVT